MEKDFSKLTREIQLLPDYIENGIISGGMIPKVEFCKKAVEHGVKKAHIVNGKIENVLLLEVFTKEGIGTEFFKN